MKPYFETDLGTLYHGDCLETLQGVHAVDAVVSDPPFTFAGGPSNGMGSAADNQFFRYWLIDVFKALHLCSKGSAPWFLWCDWRTASVYDEALSKAGDRYDRRRVSQVLIHDREMVGMGSPFRNQLDWIAVIRGKGTDFGDRIPKNQPNIHREYWYYGKHEYHDAEKSPSFTAQLVNWASDKGGIVLDCFFGSGTTGIACERFGRKWIGIEKEEGICEVAAKRIDAEVKQGRLFALGG